MAPSGLRSAFAMGFKGRARLAAYDLQPLGGLRRVREELGGPGTLEDG